MLIILCSSHVVSYENFPIFFSLLTFSPVPSPLFPLFSFYFLFMITSSLAGLHSPCSFRQKKVMFLPRRIPSSTPHTPSRRKGWLTKPSSGLTWLWLVATAFQAFFKKSYVLFYLAKYSKVLLYSLFIIFVKRNIFSSTPIVLIIQNGKKNKPM